MPHTKSSSKHPAMALLFRSTSLAISSAGTVPARFTEAIKWVSMLTGCPSPMGAAGVLGMRDWFKVQWVHARTVLAEVVEFSPRWNRANEALICPSMGRVHRLLVFSFKLPISMSATGGGPYPARRIIPEWAIFINFGPKALLRSLVMSITHWNWQSFTTSPLSIMFNAERPSIVGLPAVRNSTIRTRHYVAPRGHTAQGMV